MKGGIRMKLRIKINETQKCEYRKKGYWGDATLVDYFHLAVRTHPEKCAIVDYQGTRYTYAELDHAANKVASFLKKVGVEPGDFVSIQLPGWSEFAIIYIACLKVGAIVNPILPNFREMEISYILNKCESKVLFIPSKFKKFEYTSMFSSLLLAVPSLKEIVIVEKENQVSEGITLAGLLKNYSPLRTFEKREADDVAAVLFTSGTESFPKGVMLTHNNIIASEKVYAATFNLTFLDILLMPAPVAHAIGFHHGVTTAFLLGATCVLQDIFVAEETLKLIEREKCTMGNASTACVFDILRTIKKKKFDISSLRFFLCGGAPVPGYLVQQSLKAGIKVIGVYGSTESVPHTASRFDDNIDKIINTDGKALPGIEVKVVDENRQTVPFGVQGEEASRGPNVFVGYLNEPELTAKVLDDDGWYYSGDLCTMEKDGYIRINGRKKDIIIRGGENISCTEIENILLHHPNVREAAVIGMPDSRLGERACAYVVLEDKKIGLTLEEIKSFFSEFHTAKYKYPERVEIIDKLPRNEACKVQKFILRNDIRSKLKKEISLVL